MSENSTGGAPKKLSTKEILAAARAQAATAGGGAPATPQAPAAEAPVEAAPASAEKAAAAKPAADRPAGGAKPKSTAEILAAARAQAGGAAAAPSGGAAQAESGAKPAAKPAAAAGGKPKSTADILAAARAAAGAKGSSPAAAAPAGEKPAPKARPKAGAAPAAVAGPEDGGARLSVQEMLAAVRPAEAAAPAAKPAKPAGPPPMPARPVPSAATKKSAPSAEPRRNALVAIVLSPFALAWTLMTATTAIFALATARFMMPNVLTEPPRKFKVGPPSDYDLGTVATKLVAQYGIWIVHTDQYKGKNLIYALASVCTHLGCTPSWLEGEQKFKCPCHGSGFYITGINFEGPAPRPLERVGIRLAPDGMLEVDKSLKFQEEMGQWSDPASYYEVVG